VGINGVWGLHRRVRGGGQWRMGESMEIGGLIEMDQKKQWRGGG